MTSSGMALRASLWDLQAGKQAGRQRKEWLTWCWLHAARERSRAQRGWLAAEHWSVRETRVAKQGVQVEWQQHVAVQQQWRAPLLLDEAGQVAV